MLGGVGSRAPDDRGMDEARAEDGHRGRHPAARGDGHEEVKDTPTTCESAVEVEGGQVGHGPDGQLLPATGVPLRP